VVLQGVVLWLIVPNENASIFVFMRSHPDEYRFVTQYCAFKPGIIKQTRNKIKEVLSKVFIIGSFKVE
jgi:hypothetical protein